MGLHGVESETSEHIELKVRKADPLRTGQLFDQLNTVVLPPGSARRQQLAISTAD